MTRTFLQLPYDIAPFKCVVLSLVKKDSLIKKVYDIERVLKQDKIRCKTDCGSSSIGKRYSRTDALGIPLAITVDFQTLEDNTVTLRSLEDTKQIRLSVKELLIEIKRIESGQIQFSDLISTYGLFELNDV